MAIMAIMDVMDVMVVTAVAIKQWPTGRHNPSSFCAGNPVASLRDLGCILLVHLNSCKAKTLHTSGRDRNMMEHVVSRCFECIKAAQLHLSSLVLFFNVLFGVWIPRR
jgi:hypothetical protein